MTRRNILPALSLLAATVFLDGAAPGPLRAADSGASVVVIYNKNLPASKEVADYYASRRQVPAAQVLGLDLPLSEVMSRAQFEQQLQQPLLDALVQAKLFKLATRNQARPGTAPTEPRSRVLEARVRYAVLCYGVPTRILADTNLVERGSADAQPGLRNNGAAVDSELACLPLAAPYPLAGPLPNPLLGATNAAQLHPVNGILLVGRLDGPSPAIARRLVDLAIEAETNGLWGRAYFDARGITNLQAEPYVGDNWMRAAARFARQMGFETTLDDKPETFSAGFPMSHIALYAGWYDWTVSGPFTRPTVEFMPGAFAYHLHSFSAGTIRSTNQNWVGPLLAKGATITLGAVDEPFLGGTPDIVAFLMRLIGAGFSFGEAAWACQNSLSWQILAVGDPLYRPFGRRAAEQHAALEKRQSKLIEWSHLRWVNVNMGPGADPGEGVTDLEGLPLTRASAVLTEKLGDLYWANKRLTDAFDTYEQALKLGPSPQQRLRLLLTLAQRRTQFGPDLAAFNWWQQLLKEFPDYPDALKAYEQLLPLARKLDKPDVVARCEQEIKRLSPPPTR